MFPELSDEEITDAIEEYYRYRAWQTKGIVLAIVTFIVFVLLAIWILT